MTVFWIIVAVAWVALEVFGWVARRRLAYYQRRMGIEPDRPERRNRSGWRLPDDEVI